MCIVHLFVSLVLSPEDKLTPWHFSLLLLYLTVLICMRKRFDIPYNKVLQKWIIKWKANKDGIQKGWNWIRKVNFISLDILCQHESKSFWYLDFIRIWGREGEEGTKWVSVCVCVCMSVWVCVWVRVKAREDDGEKQIFCSVCWTSFAGDDYNLREGKQKVKGKQKLIILFWHDAKDYNLFNTC